MRHTKQWEEWYVITNKHRVSVFRLREQMLWSICILYLPMARQSCLTELNFNTHLFFSLYVAFVYWILFCKHRWHITSWSSCSTTCGHGVVTRQVTCKKKVKNPGKYEPASGCPGSKPTLLQKPCFAVPCPPEWVPGPWAKVTISL